jgi:hypothetical protein
VGGGIMCLYLSLNERAVIKSYYIVFFNPILKQLHKLLFLQKQDSGKVEKNFSIFKEKHLDIFLFFVQKPATFVRFFLKDNDSYPNRQASSIKNVRTSLFEGVRTL